MVHEAADERTALERLTDLAPDVLLVGSGTTPVVELRRRADYATSIIVIGRKEDEPERLRNAGADAVLSPADNLAYEIHRADSAPERLAPTMELVSEMSLL
jgi:hypothetical protein